jgi:NADH:ubiquinone oxidoreductase subunit C
MVLKAKTSNRKDPVLVSVSDIWKTADFLEREVFDLLGITFRNHPDMRRIFLDENWIGYPLRKDYVDELNIIER